MVENMGKCKVVFTLHKKLILDKAMWPPLAAESLWAEKVGPRSARLLNSPFYAEGVSYLDEVRTKDAFVPPTSSPDEGGSAFVEFESVIEHSGHGTVRAILLSEDGREQAEKAISQIEKLGCTWESSDVELPTLSIDIPPNANHRDVMAILEAAASSGLYIDVGYLPQQ